MEKQKHKYDIVVDRIRLNSFGEEVFHTCSTHQTWAKSEAKAISNIKYRLFGTAMNSVLPDDEEIFYKATLII